MVHGTTTSGNKAELYVDAWPPAHEVAGTWECVGCGTVYHQDVQVCPSDSLPLRKTGDTAVGGMAEVTKYCTDGIRNPFSPSEMECCPLDMPLLSSEKSTADRPKGLLSG